MEKIETPQTPQTIQDLEDLWETSEIPVKKELPIPQIPSLDVLIVSSIVIFFAYMISRHLGWNGNF